MNLQNHLEPKVKLGKMLPWREPSLCHSGGSLLSKEFLSTMSQLRHIYGEVLMRFLAAMHSQSPSFWKQGKDSKGGHQNFIGNNQQLGIRAQVR